MSYLLKKCTFCDWSSLANYETDVYAHSPVDCPACEDKHIKHDIPTITVCMPYILLPEFEIQEDGWAVDNAMEVCFNETRLLYGL